MAQDFPTRPDTAETAGPEAGRDGIGGWTAAWMDEMGSFGGDPRHWRTQAHTGTGGIEAASAALADPHARAVLDQRLGAGTAAALEIEPGGTAPRDRIAADSLAEQFAAIEIDRISRELLHAVWYGYAVAEAIWEIDGATVRLADLKTRDPARFRFRRDGAPLLITRDQPRGVELAPAKFVVLRQPRRHGGEAHGPGVARWCLWPVLLKRHGVRFWSTALEKFGSPTGVITVSQQASQTERDKALKVLAAMTTGAGIALPDGQKIELLDNTRRAGGDYREFVATMDSMIADAVLSQRATSEIGQWQATADAHKEVLQRLVAADARRLSAALQQSLATWLTHWNHPGAAVPRLARNTAPPEDLESRARRDVALAGIGGLRPTQAYIEQTYGGEWEAVAPEAGPETEPERGPRNKTGEFASDAGEVDTIARLAAEAQDHTAAPGDVMIDRIHDLVMHAASLDEVADGLLGLHTDMDGAPYADRLAEALSLAELMGRDDLATTPGADPASDA